MSSVEKVSSVNVGLIDSPQNGDAMVVMAARVSQDAESYLKELTPGKEEGLINYLYKNRHMSPFEHGSFTFVVHVPIFVARQWHRHRTQSLNEISGRYSKIKDTVYVPESRSGRPLVQTGKIGHYNFESGSDEQQAIADAAFDRCAEVCFDEYQKMLDAGIAKEVARMVLGQNTMTTFYATMNPRNLMHFLGLRNASDAQYEIREAARQMEEILKEKMPLTHKAFTNNRFELSVKDEG